MTSVRRTALAVVIAVAGGLLTATPAQAEPYDTAILRTTINNGKPIVMGGGAAAAVTVPVTATVREDSGGLATIDARLQGLGGGYLLAFLEGPTGANMTCGPATSGTLTCTGTAILHQHNMYATIIGRKVGLQIFGYAHDGAQYLLLSDPGDNVTVVNETRLTTAVASPDPVRKGGTLTVTGRLTQPDRSAVDADSNYLTAGYAKQPVRLQLRKAGATAYTTVKTVTSASGGRLTTTVAAGASGTWRWSFGGNSAAAASVSAGDSVRLHKVSKLTVNASPEPVRKGGKLTVTGRLTRATTDAATRFVGHGSQPVKLQFRKYGGSAYTTVKTVRTDAGGYLKTAATASGKGYWRWSYAGSSAVASISASADYVTVK